MKLIIPKKQLPETPLVWLRRAGYAYLPAGSFGRGPLAGGHAGRGARAVSGQDSFVRRFSRDFYPRFHLYFTEEKDSKSGEALLVFNLHLDQKKPGYAGFHRHNAEYESEVVAGEVARLRGLLSAAAAAREL